MTGPAFVPQLRHNYPKGRSLDIATKRAGFTSTESYERAESVDHDGFGAELALIPKLNMAPRVSMDRHGKGLD